MKLLYEKARKNLLIVALLVNAFFLLLSYETFNVNKSSEIVIYSYGNKNELSSAASVRLVSISSDGTEINLSSIPLPENFVYDSVYDDIIYEGLERGKEAILPLHLEAAENIVLTFASNEYCGLIGIQDGENYQEIDLYNQENSAYYYNVRSNIKHETFPNISIQYLIAVGIVSLIIVGYLCIINTLTKDKEFNKNVCILTIKIFCLNFLLLIIARYYLKLKFEQLLISSSLLLIGLISKISLKDISTKVKVAISVFSVWIAFSLWGSAIFLPLGKLTINMQDILVFILLTCLIYRIFRKLIDIFVFKLQQSVINFASNTVDWFFKYRKIFIIGWLYVITVLIYYVGSPKWNIEFSIFWLLFLGFCYFFWYFFKKRENHFMMYFLISLFAMLPIALICNPANMTSDSFDQLSQIMKKQYNDHHPVMHTLWEQGILLLFHRIEAITFIQIIIFSFVNAKGAYYLRQKGVNEKCVYFLLYVSALWPSTLISTVTLWKDIMFCVAILWLTVLLAQILDDINGFFENKFRIIETFIVFFIVGTFRHNGSFVLGGLILIISIVIFGKSKKICRGILIIGMGVIVIGSKNLILSKLDAVPNGSLVSVVLYHGLAYEKYENVEVEEKTDEFLDSIMPINLAKELYNPSSANPYMFTEEAKENNAMAKFKGSNLEEVLTIYLKDFLRNPYLLIKDRLYGTDLLWDVFQGTYSYNDMYAAEFGANNLGLSRKYTPFESIIKSILRVSEKCDAIFWRGGICIDILMILLIVGCIIGLRNIVLMLLPTILNVVSLFLSMAWQDYRYVWFLWLVLPFVFSYVVLVPRETKDEALQK